MLEHSDHTQPADSLAWTLPLAAASHPWLGRSPQ